MLMRDDYSSFLKKEKKLLNVKKSTGLFKEFFFVFFLLLVGYYKNKYALNTCLLTLSQIIYGRDMLKIK